MKPDILIKQLHEKAQTLARELKRAEVELIDILQKLDEKKFFRNLGYTSLFDYCVKCLGLSESVSYNLITVARKSVQVPELKEAISQGKVTLSKAKKMTAVINKANQSEWIEKAQTLTQKELEKEVAKVAPKQAVPERATYVTETRVSLQLGVSEELMQKLRRAQDLLSQKSQRSVDLEETLQSMTEFFLEKQDPVQKAERVLGKALSKTATVEPKEQRAQSKPPQADGCAATQNSSQELLRKTLLFWEEDSIRTHRQPISARTQHEIVKRDRNQCTHVQQNGARCSNRRWLEVHHVKPISRGGRNTIDNLVTLCAAHHKMAHAQPQSISQRRSHLRTWPPK